MRVIKVRRMSGGGLALMEINCHQAASFQDWLSRAYQDALSGLRWRRRVCVAALK